MLVRRIAAVIATVVVIGLLLACTSDLKTTPSASRTVPARPAAVASTPAAVLVAPTATATMVQTIATPTPPANPTTAPLGTITAPKAKAPLPTDDLPLPTKIPTPTSTSEPLPPTPTPLPQIGHDVVLGNHRWKVISASKSGKTYQHPRGGLYESHTGLFIVVMVEYEYLGGDENTYGDRDIYSEPRLEADDGSFNYPKLLTGDTSRCLDSNGAGQGLVSQHQVVVCEYVYEMHRQGLPPSDPKISNYE